MKLFLSLLHPIGLESQISLQTGYPSMMTASSALEPYWIYGIDSIPAFPSYNHVALPLE